MKFPPETLADTLPNHAPRLQNWLPLPPPKPPVPRWLGKKLGLNPGRKGVTYWAQKEDPARWKDLVNRYGLWACQRSASFTPFGDWYTLEGEAITLYGSVVDKF